MLFSSPILQIIFRFIVLTIYFQKEKGRKTKSTEKNFRGLPEQAHRRKMEKVKEHKRRKQWEPVKKDEGEPLKKNKWIECLSLAFGEGASFRTALPPAC